MKAAAAVAQLDANRVAIVVGLGLIGRSITQSLSKRRELQIIGHNQDPDFWSVPGSLLDLLKERLAQLDSADIEIIWCAGKAGFAASSSETDKELAFFKDCILALSTKYGSRLCVNFVSSAGALYEQNNAKLTPYGELKQQQELCLKEHTVRHRLFRVGTVYDAPAQGVRLGLIAKMIKDAQLGLATTLYASAHTRRDFLLVDDVGRYIVRKLLSNTEDASCVLVSGRAVSLHTLVLMLEKILKRKVKVNFMTSTFNDSDFLYAPSVLPADFTITSLEEGLRLAVNRSQTSQRQLDLATDDAA